MTGVSTSETLTVALGERSYDIAIGTGLIAQAGALLTPYLKRKRTFIVTDANVGPLYAGPLTKALASEGITADIITLPAGEATKSFAQVQELVLSVLAKGLERSDTLIALGGGVIGDLTGFAAAIALRGVAFIQIPTTLLAQVDSSVGGKTGIDTNYGKNTVGAFYQPAHVLIDTGVLRSLPLRELKAGYAEIVKYGLIRDAAFFDWLDKGGGTALLGGDDAARIRAIRRSCAMKAEIVAADEREAGERALLNLGHTFGHALESETGFSDALIHGEAVSIGMAMAAAFSVKLGLCPSIDEERIRAHLKATDMPAHIADLGLNQEFAPERVLAHMQRDKKVQDGRITLVLLKGIGNAFLTRAVEDAALLDFLRTYLK
jgi:3-dehydroquinate synthase